MPHMIHYVVWLATGFFAVTVLLAQAPAAIAPVAGYVAPTGHEVMAADATLSGALRIAGLVIEAQWPEAAVIDKLV
jgi:hypothetical protein